MTTFLIVLALVVVGLPAVLTVVVLVRSTLYRRQMRRVREEIAASRLTRRPPDAPAAANGAPPEPEE